MSSNPVKDLILKKNWKPRSAVWELTLACNLRCGHCGSRAGRSLPDELNTTECFDLVSQLKSLGCELITLSGGEPTLREDWDVIARHIHDQGIHVNMVTNGVYGKNLTPTEIAKRALDAGMCNVGVSIDGPQHVHDQIRGSGTYEKTTASIRAFRQVGLSTTIMTTVNRLNAAHLETLREIAMVLGANALRFQLAKPMGTMDDHRDWVIRPNEILTLMPRLAAMKQQGGIDIRLGDSLGYYGKPDKILRAWSWKRKRTRWAGCQAGMQALGIQANGDIKGCLSMQACRGDTDPFVEGNVRESSLADIWFKDGAFAYNREFSLDHLTHDCATCKQAALCRGGARCISSAVDGTLTHDDYCYFRLLSEREQLSWATVGKSAAAAALMLSINTAGCKEEDNGTTTSTDSQTATSSDSVDSASASEQETDTPSESALDTDSMSDSDTTPVLEYGAEPDYAVEPDTDTPSDSTTDTDSMGDSDTTPVLEYGAEPDYAVEPDTDTPSDSTTETDSMDDSDTTPVLEYGAEPDYGLSPGDGGINDTDSNQVDYAVEPDTDSYMLDYAVEPDTDSYMLDYAVEPEATDSDTDYSQPDYAVEMDYAVNPPTGVKKK